MSEVPVTVLEEERIEDGASFLLELADAGRLLLIRYHERLQWLPDDDDRAVQRYVAFIRSGGEAAGIAGELLKTKRPDLLPRVEQHLARARPSSPCGR